MSSNRILCSLASCRRCSNSLMSLPAQNARACAAMNDQAADIVGRAATSSSTRLSARSIALCDEVERAAVESDLGDGVAALQRHDVQRRRPRSFRALSLAASACHVARSYGLSAKPWPAASMSVQNAQALEVPVDAIDVRRELLDVAEHDRPRPRKLDADFVHDLAGARAHHQDAIRKSDRLLDAVRDEQHRRAPAQPQRLEIRAHLQARQRIERAERLVHEQQRRIVHQRSDQRHALAHAAGELTRILVHRVRQAQLREQFLRPAPRSSSWAACGCPRAA